MENRQTLSGLVSLAEKCIWHRYDLELCALTLKPFKLFPLT